MTIEVVREVLLWCSVVNMVLLLYWFAIFSLARGWIYRVHGKWFRLSEERFDAIHYAGMLIFKLGIFVFNIVPCIVLYIVG